MEFLRPGRLAGVALPALAVFALGGIAVGQTITPPHPALSRLAEEADAFVRLAPKVIGREVLEHTGRAGAPRIKWLSRRKAPEVTYKKTVIVSEYGFGFFREAPGSLREFRQVVSVDGRARAEAATRDPRQVLAENISSDDDLLRRRLHEEFERHGQVGSATDFGQMLLLFRGRDLGLFEFSQQMSAPLNGEPCQVIRWRQLPSTNTLEVFSGGRMMRIPMEGEVYLRTRDLMPVRITMRATLVEDDIGAATYAAEIDYERSRYGLLLPSAVHLEKRGGGNLLLIDNRSRYSDWQMFGANSAIVFDTAEEHTKK